MWYSYGKQLYADSVEVIRDGKYRGPGSVFYTILGNSPFPKVDYFGYGWDTPQNVGAMGFHIGAVEENGGWFSSLIVQYRNEQGQWANADNLRITPPLSDPDDIYRQPHFIEYYITFDPVNTTAVRIIGDAVNAGHWDADSDNVSPFTSIVELSVYGSACARSKP
jgi:hypothetical protein